MTLGRRAPRIGLPTLLTLAALVAVALTLLARRLERRAPRPGPGAGDSAPAGGDIPAEPAVGPVPPPGVAEEPAPDADWVPVGDALARVAIVIDDVGQEMGPVLELAAIGVPLTFAVLPHRRYSEQLAAVLHAAGHEVILHLPMEPFGYPTRDPGEGSVSGRMRAAEIARRVRWGLGQVPQAVGVSNHMGSRATADREVMRAVLGVVRSRSLYFLDSRTSPETVGFRMAVEMGIPAVERGLFLDARREEPYIESQVRSLLRRARAQGSVVAIGHPHPATVQVLRRSIGLLRSAGIHLVPASELAGFGGEGSG
ncbi:MAG: divergent polysaccharide deacetylase family protein [Acidobacteriota bacterium]